jgi:glycosyltransferase involved in cell wall biosynthesis
MTDRPRLRIGYLVQQFVPEVGAGPARAAEMARRWTAAGADVTIITAMPNRPEGRIHARYRGKLFAEETWEGVRVIRCWLYARPGGGLSTTLLNNASFAAMATLHAVLKAGPFDVLIASSPPYFPLPAGLLLRWLWDTPLVLELRDLWPEYLVEMGALKSGLLERAVLAIDRAMLSRAAHLVTVTEPLRRRLIEKGIVPERVTVISNGVDPERYFPAEDPPPSPALVPANGTLLVGYLGNFGAGQGLEVVLDAARRIAAAGEPVRFVLAGDGTMLGRIQESAARLELPNLEVLGAIPKEQTRAFYNNCDVCLVPLASLPIFSAALPTKLFEIMACGRPVVASASGLVPEALAESGAGWAVPPGDGAALAQALVRLGRLPASERLAMGARGVRYVAERFHRGVLADRYLRILRAAAGSSE